MQRKWPWPSDCVTGPRAVAETDKQKWQPCCESVCLSPCCMHLCFAHRSQPLSMTAARGYLHDVCIDLQLQTLFWTIFSNAVSAQPQVIVSGPLPNSYLRGLMRYCTVKAIFCLKINKNDCALLSLYLLSQPFSCLSCPAPLSELADSPRPLFAVWWSDHGHLRVQTSYDHRLY